MQEEEYWKIDRQQSYLQCPDCTGTTWLPDRESHGKPTATGYRMSMGKHWVFDGIFISPQQAPRTVRINMMTRVPSNNGYDSDHDRDGDSVQMEEGEPPPYQTEDKGNMEEGLRRIDTQGRSQRPRHRSNQARSLQEQVRRVGVPLSGGLDSPGSRAVDLVDYEVLVLQVTVATIFDFCFGPTFFLVRSLGASRGDDLYSLTLRGE